MTFAHTHVEYSRGSLALGTPYELPQGDTETIIAGIFAEIFGIDRVGANDHFFDLGGDSLIAEVFAMRLLDRTGYDFNLASLFETGSPREIADVLCRPSDESTPQEDGRPPIFMVHGRNGISFPRPDFVKSLAEGQKLRLFELPGLRGGRSYDSVEDIAGVYVAQLLDEYPRGPILLAAFCAGGLIALEMAAQFSELGRPIEHLVLLDPPMHAGSMGRIGAREHWPPPRKWAEAIVESLLPAPLLRRRREMSYRGLLAGKMLVDPVQRAKWADFPLSTIPRAKLSAAYSVYRPKPYTGPVTVFSSEEPDSAFQAGTKIAQLLPRSTVELVAKTHSDIDDPAVGRAMQTAFDVALSGHGTHAGVDNRSSADQRALAAIA